MSSIGIWEQMSVCVCRDCLEHCSPPPSAPLPSLEGGFQLTCSTAAIWDCHPLTFPLTQNISNQETICTYAASTEIFHTTHRGLEERALAPALFVTQYSAPCTTAPDVLRMLRNVTTTFFKKWWAQQIWNSWNNTTRQMYHHLKL